MIRSLTVACLALVLSACLSACGFHLRNALTLPSDLGPVRVVAQDPYSPLAESLAQALSRSGGTATAKPGAEAMATLDIQLETWGDLAIAVDAQGRAQEFTLRYATIFDLKRADGTVVVPRQSIELRRDYVSVPTNSDGTAGERELLAREMRREMVASILRRIDAVSKASAPAASDTIDAP